MGTADLPRRPLAVKFLYVAIVPANACQHIKFELSSSVSLGDMRGSQIKKWELLREYASVDVSHVKIGSTA